MGRKYRQPALLVDDQLCGDLTSRYSHREFVAEAVDHIVPAFAEFAEGQICEVWVLVGEQASNERFIDTQFRRRGPGTGRPIGHKQDPFVAGHDRTGGSIPGTLTGAGLILRANPGSHNVRAGPRATILLG